MTSRLSRDEIDMTVPLVFDNSIVNTSSIKNIVLIDSSIKESQLFYDSHNETTFPIIYNYRSKSTELLDLLNGKFNAIDRIAFIFHEPYNGNYKEFLDENSFFNEADIQGNNEYSENIKLLIDIVKRFNIKNVDFLTCNSLKYDNWKKYYDILFKETGVVVGASNDATGNLNHGGDWVMESTNEDIRDIYFTNAILNYAETLTQWSLTAPGYAIYLKQSGNDIQYSFDGSSNWTSIATGDWPVLLTTSATTSSTDKLVVTLTTDLTISGVAGTTTGGTSGYFIIGNDYTTFEGNNKKVTINQVANYPGLIQNGDSSNNGKNYVTIENFGVEVNTTGTVSRLAYYGGWIGQQYFGKGASSNNATNCYSTGDISRDYSGGIFGYGTGSYSGNVSANNCYSTGPISGEESGGIFGYYAGYSSGNASANNCYSTGGISDYSSGGIFGSLAGSYSGNASATNCYSTGTISGDESGGIFGGYAGTSGNASATNCYSTGAITGQYSGGIFGYGAGSNSGNAIATNCYSTGAITGQYSGGIAGDWFGYNTSNQCIIQNCYTTGIIGGTTANANAGGIVGAEVGYNDDGSYTPNVLIKNCYSIGNITNGSGGICGGTERSSYTNTPTVTFENCCTFGTVDSTSDGLISPNLQIKDSITLTNTSSKGDATWTDIFANTYLTGEPSSNPGVGTTWTSIVLNTPYSLSVMQKVIIASVTPTSKPSSIGTSYTIKAGKYTVSTTEYTTDLSNTSLVTFDGTTAPITSKNATTVVVTSPITSTLIVTVVVKTPDGLSQPFYLNMATTIPPSIPPVFNIGVTPTIDLPQSHLESQTIPIGDSTYFEVTVDQPKSMKYQWFFYSYKLNKQILLVGKTSPLLLLDDVTEDDEGDYFVLITNKVEQTYI